MEINPIPCKIPNKIVKGRIFNLNEDFSKQNKENSLHAEQYVMQIFRQTGLNWWGFSFFLNESTESADCEGVKMDMYILVGTFHI